MKRMSCLIVCVLSLHSERGFGSDYSLFFTISNEVSPEQPSATVTMWAAFDPKWYAFGMTMTEVWSGPDRGGFTDPQVLMKQYYLCDPGDVAPDGQSVLGIRLVQLQFIGGMFADTTNPLELWSVMWTTDDFTPREVSLWTKSSSFWVYLTGGGDGENFYGPDFSEAEGMIHVIPAPSGTAALGAAGPWSARRRRSNGAF